MNKNLYNIRRKYSNKLLKKYSNKLLKKYSKNHIYLSTNSRGGSRNTKSRYNKIKDSVETLKTNISNIYTGLENGDPNMAVTIIDFVQTKITEYITLDDIIYINNIILDPITYEVDTKMKYILKLYLIVNLISHIYINSLFSWLEYFILTETGRNHFNELLENPSLFCVFIGSFYFIETQTSTDYPFSYIIDFICNLLNHNRELFSEKTNISYNIIKGLISKAIITKGSDLVTFLKNKLTPIITKESYIIESDSISDEYKQYLISILSTIENLKVKYSNINYRNFYRHLKNRNWNLFIIHADIIINKIRNRKMITKKILGKYNG